VNALAVYLASRAARSSRTHPPSAAEPSAAEPSAAESSAAQPSVTPPTTTDRQPESLNIRGAVTHLVNDLWAFLATAVAGLVVLLTGWRQADGVASLVVAGLMVYSGVGLIRAAGRVFLEAAPVGTDPSRIGQAMASVPGVREVHDLHVWDLGAGDAALSAHLVVDGNFDCHEVAHGVRTVLSDAHRIDHATLQADHQHSGRPLLADDCARHGPGYFGDHVD
jgi:cobalt-zinc-cadmium efflux system protein